MVASRSLCLALLVLATALAAPSHTESSDPEPKLYESRFGFTIRLPPNWFALDPAQLSPEGDLPPDGPWVLNPAAARRAAESLRGGDMEYFLRAPGVGENLKIRRRRVSIPDDPAAVLERCGDCRPVEVFACELRSVDGRPAIYLEMEGVLPGTRIWQLQLRETPEAAIAITATYQREHAAAARAEFDAIIGSLRFGSEPPKGPAS